MSGRRHLHSLTAAQVFAGPGETRSLMRTTDWAATPLGAVESWSDELVFAVRLVLNSRLPVLLFWGPELIQLYNDECLPTLSSKHPAAIGQRAADCWPEVWDELRPTVQAITSGRETAVRCDGELLFFARDGFLEETYQTYSLSAITDADGAVLGIFVHNSEAVTAQVIGERRLRSLRDLGTMSTAGAGGAAEACRAICDVLVRNRADVPFCSVYLMGSTEEPHLVASFGYREGGSLPPNEGTDPAAMARVRRTAETDEPLLITEMRTRFPGFYEPHGAISATEPDSAMMLPLTEHGKSRRLGVLVLGISAHRRFDADYRAFFSLIADQVSTALTDAVAFAVERRRAEALADLDTAKTRFFQNISHEIRTPLTLLLGPLQHALDDPDLDLAGHRVDLLAARRATLRLQRLVDGLLEVARGEAGRILPATESTDLGALTSDCASMFRSVVQAAGLELVLRLPDAGRPVPVDRQMWAHIVLNLLSNAVKFTPAGTIEVRLDVSVDEAVLQVTDTGVGIPAAERSLIFDRFHQVGGPTPRTREGAGIGLSLVSDLVHAHGGSVGVVSHLGRGSTFTVTIPAARTHNAAPRPLQPPAEIAEMFLADAAQWLPTVSGTPSARPTPTEGAPEDTPPPDLIPRQAIPSAEPSASPPKGTVLVVDDNADMRGYLTRLLSRDGWDVSAVGTVDAALRHQSVPDLVLADVMLPDRDGFDLLRMVRAAPDGDRVPVVLLTARAGPESIVEGLKLGADDYLVKPFEPVELLARVRANVELHRRRESRLAQAQDRSAHLQEALSSNRRIGTAIGILMAQRKIPSDEAFELLSALSQAAHRKLRDVADEVTRTGALPAESPAQRVAGGEQRPV